MIVRIGAMLPLAGFLSCMCLGNVVTATQQYSEYRVRRQAKLTLDNNNNDEQERDLSGFVPSFSADDEALVKAEMPKLTLLLRGLEGEPLGDRSYDAIQTAMEDYLEKLFENYFQPKYDFRSAEAEVVGDSPFEGYLMLGGNAIKLNTTLFFHDPDYESPEEANQESSELSAMVQQKRTRNNYNRPIWRQSDAFGAEAAAAQSSSDAIPSPLELEFAAGEAWNDLSSFRNHLLVAANLENIGNLAGVIEVDKMESFPTNEEGETAEEIAVVEEVEEEEATEETNDAEEEEAVEATEAPADRAEVGNNLSNNGNSLNVAAATSQLTESGSNRINPLFPALFVGIAVFLCTIIALGYRKQKSRSRDRNKSEKDYNVVVQINDNSTLEGDDEIEVEDQFYSYTPSEDPQEQRKQQERDLDKEYAKSCMKAPALVKHVSLGSSKPDDADFSDDEDEIERGTGRKNCLKGISLRGKKNDSKRSLQEQDSMAYDSNESRGIDLPRKVDLTTSPDQSSWRNPARLREDNYGDGELTKSERKKFAKYMQSGMTVEQASSQVLSERKDDLPTSPSATTRTRSGELGGYSAGSKRRNSWSKSSSHRASTTLGQEQGQCGDKISSHPMDCITPSHNAVLSPCAEQTLHSELMDDGTGVHFVSRPSYMSLGDACGTHDANVVKGMLDSENGKKRRNGSHTSSNHSGFYRDDVAARAMVITEASSYGSSFDDADFDAALDEAAARATAETAMA